jgi:hypothetical protein
MSPTFHLYQVTKQVTIANGATTSGEVDLGQTSVVALLMPADFTGTAITFLSAEAAGGTFRTVTNADGTDYSVVVAGGVHVALDPSALCGVRFLKLVSDAAEGGARTVILATRGL